MIITVTLNPALDRTLYVDSALVPGDYNVASRTSVEPGGKGINVSRAIRAFGGKSVALGFSAGSNGRFMKDALTSADIHHDFVDVPGETRVNTQIIDIKADHTTINERGFAISAPHYERFLERVESYLAPENIFVISGSVPVDFTVENFRRLCKKIKKAGCRMIINVSGEFLDEALTQHPDYVKQTKAELYRYLGRPEQNDPEQIAKDAMVFLERGAKAVAISLEHDGAVFLSPADKEAIYVVCNPKIYNEAAIGTGDAMVAAIANGMEKGFEYGELCKFAHASSRAAAKLPGTMMPTLSEVFRVQETLEVYTIFTM